MLPPLLTTTDKDNYDTYFEEKVQNVTTLLENTLFQSDDQQGFNDLKKLKYVCHSSIPEHYRMRSEFAVYHYDDHSFDYVMYKPKTKPREMIIIKEFKGCTLAINQTMSAVRSLVPQYPNLRYKLFEVDFLSNQKGDVVISFNYHRKLEDTWLQEANDLREQLKNSGLNCSLVAHAKKQKLVVGDDFVIETLHTTNRDIQLKQVEGTFSQPNAHVCTKMVNFAISCVQNQKDRDLIELYCGSGTFTIALAPYFRQAFATEVARVPTETAIYNMQLNHIDNLKLARLSAVEVSEALTKVRTFKRLKDKEIDLDSYDFSTILVDPPRAGIQDPQALAFTAQYDNIIYISCGPDSLAQDLITLSKTHKIERVEFFDQFPYTHHLESGVFLTRRNK